MKWPAMTSFEMHQKVTTFLAESYDVKPNGTFCIMFYIKAIMSDYNKHKQRTAVTH